MTPKNQRGTFTLAIFRMLNFDDFIMHSNSKLEHGSARNSIVEKLAFLGAKGPLLVGHFFDAGNFLYSSEESLLASLRKPVKFLNSHNR